MTIAQHQAMIETAKIAKLENTSYRNALNIASTRLDSAIETMQSVQFVCAAMTIACAVIFILHFAGIITLA